MRRIAIAVSAVGILAATGASADDFVNGYYRQNGTYVNPYMRTAPDGNPFNNYSTRGNVNPYTGAVGTHNPYATFGAPSTLGPSIQGPSTTFGGYPSYGGIR